MELREVLNFYKKHSKSILLGSLIFMLFGVAVYLLPSNYVASASFVVVRDIESKEAEFSYEGYYAQLTSQDFSKNLISFFENESILDQTARDLNIDRTELKRRIRVVKEAPSVSRLEVRHASADVARDIWLSLKDQALEVVDKINQETDSSMGVIVIGDEPVVRQTYKNIYLYGASGFLMGGLLSSFYFALKEYLK